MLKDVLDRMSEYDMAHHPNDCAELRWGLESSEEAAICKRCASRAQKAKMGSDYRNWLRERHWPMNT